MPRRVPWLFDAALFDPVLFDTDEPPLLPEPEDIPAILQPWLEQAVQPVFEVVPFP